MLTQDTLPPALQSLQRWKLDLGHSAWSLQELIKHNSNLYIYRSIFDDSNRIKVNPTFQVLPQDLFELCSCSTSTSGMNWALQVREKCVVHLQLETQAAGMARLSDLPKATHENSIRVQFYCFIFFFSYKLPATLPLLWWEHQYKNQYKWHIGTAWNPAKHLTAGEVAKNEEQKSFRFASLNANSIYLSFYIKIN